MNGFTIIFLSRVFSLVWFDGHFLHLVAVVFIAEREKDPGTIFESLMN